MNYKEFRATLELLELRLYSHDSRVLYNDAKSMYVGVQANEVRVGYLGHAQFFGNQYSHALNKVTEILADD